MMKSESDIVKSLNPPNKDDLANFAKAAGIGKFPCTTADADVNAQVGGGALASAEASFDASNGCTNVAMALSAMLQMTNAMSEQVTDSCTSDITDIRTDAEQSITISMGDIIGCKLDAKQEMFANISLNITDNLTKDITNNTKQNLSSVLNNLQSITQLRDSSGVGGTAVNNSISTAQNKQNNFVNASNCQLTSSETTMEKRIRETFTQKFTLNIGDCKNSTIKIDQRESLAIAHVISNTLHNVFVTSGSQTLSAITKNAQKEFQKTSTKGANQGLQGMGKWAAIIGGVLAGIVVIGIVAGMLKRRKPRKTTTITTTTTVPTATNKVPPKKTAPVPPPRGRSRSNAFSGSIKT